MKNIRLKIALPLVLIDNFLNPGNTNKNYRQGNLQTNVLHLTFLLPME